MRFDSVPVTRHGETSSFGHERLYNPFIGDAALARWRSDRFLSPARRGPD